jgi:hypothetical protein
MLYDRTWSLFAAFESNVGCVEHLKATSLHHPTAGFEAQLHARGPRTDTDGSVRQYGSRVGPTTDFRSKIRRLTPSIALNGIGSAMKRPINFGRTTVIWDARQNKEVVRPAEHSI